MTVAPGCSCGLVVVPSLVGVMLGAKVGARVLRVAPAPVIRYIVLVVLLVAGGRALAKGLGF